MATTTMQERKPIALQTTPSIIEDDTIAHIEDTSLYWVTRANRAVKLSWNEMSAQEQAEQIQAKERADFVAMFDPDYSYAY